jgi:hypothetical protein
MVGRVRLLKATLGVFTATRLARAVPEGSIIEIPTAPSQNARLVDVIWDGNAMMMFVQDLRERSEIVSGAADV